MLRLRMPPVQTLPAPVGQTVRLQMLCVCPYCAHTTTPSARARKITHTGHLCAPLQVLLRALRDFNLGKLTSDDTSIFMGLLNDLFPKTLEQVPRAVDKVFEAKVSAQRRPRV